MQNQTTLPVTPTATTSAGGWLQQGNALLSNAIGLWGQVEAVKAQKSTSGGDQVAKQTAPELANGAAIKVDVTATDQQAASVTPSNEINKGFLMFSVGVLVMGLAMKAKGFK
ncbi:hypothetical protein [Alteromonas lipotrueae]|uniref:hypothetical protein n=1 Tax=Alteromonas lipotrueae TaxID=2803814 RepID=UPI001C485949|nr:hypothetical protein [Alteromonas lipotrueae]